MSPRPVLVALLAACVAVAGSGAPLAADTGPTDPLRTRVSAVADEGVGEPPGGKGPPPLFATPDDGLARALRRGDVSDARYALERARTLSKEGYRRARARFGEIARPGPRDATLILRDLVLRLWDLSPAELEEARRLLARPTDGTKVPGLDEPKYAGASLYRCRKNVCVHWEEGTSHSPPPEDANGNGVPDWVEQVLTVFQGEVWKKQVEEYGFRPPKSDASSPNKGPNGKLDVYLADTGAQRIYGYCTSDDPNASSTYPYWDLSAYCVIDNDFSASQFPTPSANGLEGLRVTAAHEFFHAVQFAYNAYEDSWLMEGTAVWMEDEVYDDIDDHHNYLPWSALRRPRVPVDTGSPPYHYGAWVFWRFLSEYFVSDARPGYRIVRRVWELVDGAPGGRNLSSIRAVTGATAERQYPFRFAFADFGALNVVPRRFYREGTRYPTPPRDRTYTIGRNRKRVGTATLRLDHLTNRYVTFRPGKGAFRRHKLLVTVDLPPYASGPEATVVVRLNNGGLRFHPIGLNWKGEGIARFPFSRVRVKEAVLVLTNASTRFRHCGFFRTVYSCRGGVPRDDGLPYRFSVRLVR